MIPQQRELKEPNGTPKVSIVLPLYNSAGEVAEVLAELDRQSYHDREIILVDDGSTDGTQVATDLSSGRKDVTVVETNHGGASHARNVGVERARGEIVFFAESDCVYDESYLQKAVERLDSEPEAGAVCLTGAPLITRSTLATRVHRHREQGPAQAAGPGEDQAVLRLGLPEGGTAEARRVRREALPGGGQGPLQEARESPLRGGLGAGGQLAAQEGPDHPPAGQEVVHPRQDEGPLLHKTPPDT